jgi:hypothetical protein
VDGAIVDENTSEPFNIFTWDLKPRIHVSSEHQIVVEAVDVLGLSKTSMPVPILVTVIKPPSGPQALLAKYRTPITFGSIIWPGWCSFFILLSGRLRIPTLRAVQEARRAQADPLTQPIKALADEPVPHRHQRKNPKADNQSQRKQKQIQRTEKEAAASLVRINPDGQFAAVPPIRWLKRRSSLAPIPCNARRSWTTRPSRRPCALRLTDDGGYLLQDNQFDCRHMGEL